MKESDIFYYQRAETIYISAKLICQQFSNKIFACWKGDTQRPNRIDIAISSYLAWERVTGKL